MIAGALGFPSGADLGGVPVLRAVPCASRELWICAGGRSGVPFVRLRARRTSRYYLQVAIFVGVLASTLLLNL